MAKAKSKIIAEKTIFAAFKILKEHGGELRGKEVIEKIRETVEFNDHEKHRYTITGHIRWESVLQFYTIDCIKAGFLRKLKGVWMLTKEGEAAIQLGPEKLLSTATKIYLEWDAKREKEDNYIREEHDIGEVDTPKGQAQQAIIDQLQENASSGIREFLRQKNKYEFQDFVAALLCAMGYHISQVISSDSGIDIIAYNDPLGTTQPRIIVKIRHNPTKEISLEDIQKLAGNLKRTTDVGIFVTSGNFAKSAEIEARSYREHIELIGIDRLTNLWTEYYPKLSDEHKNMLPIQSINFLGSNDLG